MTDVDIPVDTGDFRLIDGRSVKLSSWLMSATDIYAA